MKRTVLILSLVAPVLLYVVGGFLFAASGFSLDFDDSPTSPRRIVGALLGYIPGLILLIVAMVLSLSATGRNRQTGWFVGLLVWPIIPIAAPALMVTGVVGLSESWWLAALFLPLATLLYSVLGPAPLATTASQGAPGASERTPTPLAPFLGFVSVLALVTLLGIATLVRGAPPFTAPPTATPTIGPLALTVQVADGSANCTDGSYPTVTITNALQQTVAWSANVNDAGLAITLTSGSLAAEASMIVTIIGKATTTSFFTITFTAQGSENLAKIACVSG